jgi:hypothetical protein
MRPDWTVPFDDMLCLRWRTCVFCGQESDRVELRYLASGYAMSMGLCQRCVRADATEARRNALVAQQAQRGRGRRGLSPCARGAVSRPVLSTVFIVRPPPRAWPARCKTFYNACPSTVSPARVGLGSLLHMQQRHCLCLPRARGAGGPSSGLSSAIRGHRAVSSPQACAAVRLGEITR